MALYYQPNSSSPFTAVKVNSNFPLVTSTRNNKRYSKIDESKGKSPQWSARIQEVPQSLYGRYDKIGFIGFIFNEHSPNHRVGDFGCMRKSISTHHSNHTVSILLFSNA